MNVQFVLLEIDRMKKLLTIAAIIGGLNTMVAQGNSSELDIARNSIFAEAFGQGFCWSVNYDRLLNVDRKVKNSYSIGVVYVPKSVGFGDGTYYGIPFSYNWLFGKKNHHLELGVGVTSLIVDPYWAHNVTSYYTYMTPKIGYRYQRSQGGLFFRATATSMIDLLNVSVYKYDDLTVRHFSTLNDVAGLGYAIFPWPGMSIGYTFK